MMSINSESTLGNITGKAIDVRGKRIVFVRCSWQADGAPIGKFGIKEGVYAPGGATVRSTDYGFIDGGRFLGFIGTQPDGTGAGSIAVQFETGADTVEVYYTRTSAGAVNSATADVAAS
jgi:hypothetical protein